MQQDPLNDSIENETVGGIYDEFERELEIWRHKYATRPRNELIRLFLLALEREELVAVAYRDELISNRLKTMPISREAREIVRHALIWAWKDEQMHSIFIRGAIFKLSSLPLRILAILNQTAGAIGGWSSSIRQHVSWSQAPFSRALATVITWTGFVTGKVPKSVREHLQYRSFRDFCAFNIEAERTAWLCWNRVVELAAGETGLPLLLLEDFRKILADEARHQRIFEILATAFDDKDHLMTGETAELLAQKIGAVGECFLPRMYRTKAVIENPVGSGGKVWVFEGKSVSEKLSLFRRLLDESGLVQRLEERAKFLGKTVRELRIAIKPTFMLGYHRKDLSVITDPELLKELARYLWSEGCQEIAIVEGRNIYDRFFKHRSVREVADYFNIKSPHFRVVDLSDEQIKHSYFRGMAQNSVGQTWKEADFRFSFAKIRSHPIEFAHLTISNVEGLGARFDEFFFVERQAQRETATMMILDEFPPHFAILDAYEHGADGLVGVIGCPHPPSPLRFYAGSDALAVDSIAIRDMGMKDHLDSPILRAACHWFGSLNKKIEIVGTDQPLKDWRNPYENEFSAALSLLASPIYSLGSGRGALFVPEMDKAVFPPIVSESFRLRIGRRLIQTLLGLRHSK